MGNIPKNSDRNFITDEGAELLSDTIKLTTGVTLGIFGPVQKTEAIVLPHKSFRQLSMLSLSTQYPIPDSNPITKAQTLLRLATKLASLETLHLRMENIAAITLSNYATNNIEEDVTCEPIFTDSKQIEMILSNTPNLLRLGSRIRIC